MSSRSVEPDQYVKENREHLAYVIKHSNDQFVRSLCLAALVKYGGEEEDPDELKREIEQIKDRVDSH